MLRRNFTEAVACGDTVSCELAMKLYPDEEIHSWMWDVLSNESVRQGSMELCQLALESPYLHIKDTHDERCSNMFMKIQKEVKSGSLPPLSQTASLVSLTHTDKLMLMKKCYTFFGR
jgi:hypothetical protein